MRSNYEVFSAAERIELLSREIYLAIADAFPDSALVPTLRQLAEEEGQHAARVRLLATRYRQSPRLFDAVAFDLGAIERLLADAGRLLEDVVAGRWRGNLDGLLAHVSAMEARGAISHADVLAMGSDPQVAEFFRQLARQDRAHAAMLKP